MKKTKLISKLLGWLVISLIILTLGTPFILLGMLIQYYLCG